MQSDAKALFTFESTYYTLCGFQTSDESLPKRSPYTQAGE